MTSAWSKPFLGVLLNLWYVSVRSLSFDGENLNVVTYCWPTLFQLAWQYTHTILGPMVQVLKMYLVYNFFVKQGLLCV